MKKTYKNKTSWLVAFACIASLIFLALYLNEGEFNTPIRVKIFLVSKGSMHSHINASGSVIGVNDHMLNSTVSARIINSFLKEGETAAKGQMLVILDDREILAQLDRANASLKLSAQYEVLARQDLERLQQLFAAGGEARKTVEDAHLRWQTMLKDHQLALAEVKMLKIQLESFRIKSPISGVVTAISAKVGGWVKAGDTLLKLSDLSQRELEVRINADDSTIVRIGKNVVLSSDAYPGRQWQERITWAALSTNREGSSNALAVRVSLGGSSPPLVLGQQVDVKIPSVSAEQVILIPSNALTMKQGKYYVASVQNDRIKYIPVEIGLSDSISTEILKGLSVGQKIVLPDGTAHKNGDKVSF